MKILKFKPDTEMIAGAHTSGIVHKPYMALCGHFFLVIVLLFIIRIKHVSLKNKYMIIRIAFIHGRGSD